MSVDWNKYQKVGGGTEKMWPGKGETLQPGNSVEGRYVEKRSDQGSNKSMVYIIEQADGTRVGVWGSTVLDSRFNDIAIGKMVAIEYLGEEKSKKGTSYKSYEVGYGIDTVGDEGR